MRRSIARRSRTTVPLIVVAAIAAAPILSCQNPSAIGGAMVDVSGAWSYVAAAASSPTTIVGTLTITQSGQASFTGALDANQSDARGQVAHVVGIVSGRALDSTLIDFDIVLDAATRRHHSGRLAGDSVSGTWLEAGDAGILSSGTFRGKRASR